MGTRPNNYIPLREVTSGNTEVDPGATILNARHTELLPYENGMKDKETADPCDDHTKRGARIHDETLSPK